MSLKSSLGALYLLVMISASHAQEVQFHAWGGSVQVNQYIQWLSAQARQELGISVNHVKLADTSDAVSRVLAEKAAGNTRQGSVDLIWLNGENFAAMKQHGLLHKGWVSGLPHFKLTNPAQNPGMTMDFGVPTDEQEAPWGKAALVFYYNQAHINQPPHNVTELLEFARQYPGRFTYPLPVDYLGSSFLKYIAITQAGPWQSLLYAPVTDEARDKITERMFAYLDQLHPYLWQQGQQFKRQASGLQQLFSDHQTLLSFTFTAAEVPAAVSRYDLPASTRTYAMQDGSLSNVHFVAIAFNSAHKAQAIKLVNFMLSVPAQAYKQRADIWGDETVLDVSLLSDEQQALFVPTTAAPSALPAGAYHKMLAEPHASWTEALKAAWFDRYQRHH